MPQVGAFNQRNRVWSSGLEAPMSSKDFLIRVLQLGIRVFSACSILEGITKRLPSINSFTAIQARVWLSSIHEAATFLDKTFWQRVFHDRDDDDDHFENSKQRKGQCGFLLWFVLKMFATT